MTAIRPVLVVLALCCACASGKPAVAPAETKPEPPANTRGGLRMTGHGGFPLTDEVTSLWAAIDEPQGDKVQTFTFLIYFRGEPGWHTGAWASNARLGDEPARVEFRGERATLAPEFVRATRTLRLFRAEVPIESANVVLVEDVDRPGKQRVVPLGKVLLQVPEDSNPAIHVLQLSPAFRERVFGSR